MPKPNVIPVENFKFFAPTIAENKKTGFTSMLAWLILTSKELP
jgi:hypothetical protein